MAEVKLTCRDIRLRAPGGGLDVNIGRRLIAELVHRGDPINDVALTYEEGKYVLLVRSAIGGRTWWEVPPWRA